jgi:hypothetical protein
MRRFGFLFNSAWTLHRARSLEQVEVPMFQFVSMKSLGVICALVFALTFAQIASADSTEVAGLISANSNEGVAAILFDDAMPNGPSVADRLAVIREKIQNALEYPPLARLLESDGDALVRFEIEWARSARHIRGSRGRNREPAAVGVRSARSSGALRTHGAALAR